ncbi:MAG: hypothetical protein IKU19_09510, partial [Clostridia bacterium]|nr:hypothetical protein [Clostridia bacterium]
PGEDIAALYAPKTVKDKMSNFWYHFKWPFLVGGFLAIVILFCVVQLFIKEKPDLYIMYAGPASLTPQGITLIEESFETFDSDYNEDGKSIASLLDLVVYTNEQIEELRAESVEKEEPIAFNTQTIYTARQRFSAEISTGDTVICLLDPHMYESVYEAGGFMPLSEIFDELPEGVEAYDDCAILLSSTDFGKKFGGVNELPYDTLICVRKISTMGIFKGIEKVKAAHEYHVGVFKDIVSYTSAK